MALERKHVKKQSLNEKWRLRGSESNRLNNAKYGEGTSFEVEGSETHYRIKENGGKQFVVFDVAKDAQTWANQPELLFIGKVIQAAKGNDSLQNATLLIPMRQCRGFLKMPIGFKSAQREHIILVEVDLENRTIRAHDSQKKIRYRFYPDKLKDIAKKQEFSYEPQTDYIAYGKQKAEVECGYYVDQYAKALIEGKSCADIQFKLTPHGLLLRSGSEQEDEIFSSREEYLERPEVKKLAPTEVENLSREDGLIQMNQRK